MIRQRNTTVPRFIMFAAALVLTAALPEAACAQTPVSSAAAEVKDLPLTSAQRQAYVGDFSVRTPDGNRIRFRIYEEDGVLKGRPETDEPKRLLYQGENVFRAEDTDATLTFELEDDRAAKFTFRRGDLQLEGTREP